VQNPDLATQRAALRAYCEQQGYQPDERMEEVGSRLNYQRQHFNRVMELIELGHVRRLIVAHSDCGSSRSARTIRS
jgi:predicted site-specific integrase-resolvase